MYGIATGRDMTKLAVKERTILSMSTVISAVEDLRKEGLVSVETRRVKGGGKPHSVINARADKCVYGISYKSGRLTACVLTLGGDRIRVREREATGNPENTLAEMTQRLSGESPTPVAIGLALNCEGLEDILRALSDRTGAKVLPTTNTAALLYKAFWQGRELPLAALGVGNRVKCAVLDESGTRVTDLGSLPSAGAFTERGDYLSLLSASRVERRLRAKEYGGCYEITEEGAVETNDLSSYSRALAKGLAALTETADRLLSPRELWLFGEYVTEGFFRKASEYSSARPDLRLATPTAEDFAYGAGIAALTECVFS